MSAGRVLIVDDDREVRDMLVEYLTTHGYEVAQFLLARGILVDYRPGAGVRVAPHFYTSDAELEDAVAMIDVALDKEAWRDFEAHRSVVT